MPTVPSDVTRPRSALLADTAAAALELIGCANRWSDASDRVSAAIDGEVAHEIWGACGLTAVLDALIDATAVLHQITGVSQRNRPPSTEMILEGWRAAVAAAEPTDPPGVLQAQVVRAERFVLVAPDGTVRGGLSTDEGRDPELWLNCDCNGVIAMGVTDRALTASDSCGLAYLQLCGRDGDVSAEITVYPDGSINTVGVSREKEE